MTCTIAGDEAILPGRPATDSRCPEVGDGDRGGSPLAHPRGLAGNLLLDYTEVHGTDITDDVVFPVLSIVRAPEDEAPLRALGLSDPTRRRQASRAMGTHYDYDCTGWIYPHDEVSRTRDVYRTSSGQGKVFHGEGVTGTPKEADVAMRRAYGCHVETLARWIWQALDEVSLHILREAALPRPYNPFLDEKPRGSNRSPLGLATIRPAGNAFIVKVKSQLNIQFSENLNL
ncbi:hypothetical protein VTN02DRAFT_3611 [Thermoascus thermophilus]